MFRELSRAAVLVGVVSAVGQGIPREAEGQIRTGSDPSAVRAFELVGEIGGQIGYDRDDDAVGTERFLSVLSLPKNPRLTDAILEQLEALAAGTVRGRDESSPVELQWPGLRNFQKLVLADVGITDRGLALL